MDLVNVCRGVEHVAKEEKMVDVLVAPSSTPSFPEEAGGSFWVPDVNMDIKNSVPSRNLRAQS